jgi:hypothetical protein
MSPAREIVSNDQKSTNMNYLDVKESFVSEGPMQKSVRGYKYGGATGGRARHKAPRGRGNGNERKRPQVA